MQQLLALIGDSKWHTVQKLADRLSCTPVQIEKWLHDLDSWGLVLQRQSSDNHWRLALVPEWLDSELILAQAGTLVERSLSDIIILPVVDSTNQYLLSLPALHNHVACLAEYQSAGRGRRGRQWVSAFASGLYLSLATQSNAEVAANSSLSLAMGVAVARTLQSLGATGVQLKWPNDVLWKNRKLAGILLETRWQSQASRTVIGVGINVRPQINAAIEQPWVALDTVTGHTISRNLLAARLLEQMLTTWQQYRRDGLDSVLAEWAALDCLAGQPVNVHSETDIIQGIVAGIDTQGCLRLVGHETAFSSADVSIRRLCERS